MAVKHPDLLMPVTDRNRNEYFAMHFNNVIRSFNQAIILYMLQSDSFSSKEYPILDTFKNDKDIFNFSMCVPTKFLLAYLRGEKTPKDDDEEILHKIRKQYNPFLTYHSRMEAAIKHLLFSKNCQKIYISEPDIREYPKEIEVIQMVFGTEVDKISLVTNPISEILVEDSSITSVFLEDIEELRFILETVPTEKYKEKSFWTSLGWEENSENAKAFIEGREPLRVKYQEVFETIESKHFCQFNYFYPFMMNSF